MEYSCLNWVYVHEVTLGIIIIIVAVIVIIIIIIIIIIVSTQALGHTQPPIQWVPGAISLGIKRPGHEADHSPPFSAEVRNDGAIPILPNTPSWSSA
jgi:hypothetical protein